MITVEPLPIKANNGPGMRRLMPNQNQKQSPIDLAFIKFFWIKTYLFTIDRSYFKFLDNKNTDDPNDNSEPMTPYM
jgi:hypothetical protein